MRPGERGINPGQKVAGRRPRSPSNKGSAADSKTNGRPVRFQSRQVFCGVLK